MIIKWVNWYTVIHTKKCTNVCCSSKLMYSLFNQLCKFCTVHTCMPGLVESRLACSAGHTATVNHSLPNQTSKTCHKCKQNLSYTGCSWNIVFFPKNFVIFLNSAISPAALVFYLPGVCTHTDNERGQSSEYFKIIKKHNI